MRSPEKLSLSKTRIQGVTDSVETAVGSGFFFAMPLNNKVGTPLIWEASALESFGT